MDRTELYRVSTQILENIINDEKNDNNILFDMDIWDWSQGVALFGIWKYYRRTGERRYLEYLTQWFDTKLNRPIVHNINTMAEAIEKSMGELRSIADGRRQFIDNFAHEMKTPLTSIMGFADILRIKKNVTTRQRQEFAGIIVEEAKRLRSLSGKLLELATTESVRLDITDVDTTELFNEIYVTVFPILAKAHLTLTLDTHGIVMPLDRELIKSLLYNLVDNSAKASSPGGEIRAGCVAEGGNIVMYVSDDGSGIEPEHLRRLTEPFYMVDKSRSRSAGGAGLGLSLCDQIARIHGGRLEIESTPGKGTTVRAVFDAALTSGKETRTV